MDKKIQQTIKRAMDIIGASAGLLLLSPLFAIVSVAIKLDSPGPIFFRQERVGLRGKAFKPFKFRTMVVGSQNLGLGLNVSSNDERITAVGRYLRKLGVDELPQLINVLKGDMSLVGPRPTLRYQVDSYNDFQKQRLLAKPGITGLAIIMGRNSLSWEERIKYDVWYVRNWSFALDLKIIFKTFYYVLIKRQGVYGKNGINDPFV